MYREKKSQISSVQSASRFIYLFKSYYIYIFGLKPTFYLWFHFAIFFFVHGYLHNLSISFYFAHNISIKSDSLLFLCLYPLFGVRLCKCVYESFFCSSFFTFCCDIAVTGAKSNLKWYTGIGDGRRRRKRMVKKRAEKP